MNLRLKINNGDTNPIYTNNIAVFTPSNNGFKS